jgi:hypothetical protein
MPAVISEGDVFGFSLLLMGKAIDYFPYIAYSFLEIGKQGLGKDRIPYELDSIKDEAGNVIYNANGQNIHKPHRNSLNLGVENDSAGICDANICLETPLRIRRDGKDAHHFSAQDLLLAIIRRFEILAYFYGNKEVVEYLKDLGRNCPDLHYEAGLQPLSVTRFSGRQQKKMRLNGLTGKLLIKAIPKAYLNLLEIGEVLHIGKSTSFGFGKISVEKINRSD